MRSQGLSCSGQFDVYDDVATHVTPPSAVESQCTKPFLQIISSRCNAFCNQRHVTRYTRYLNMAHASRLSILIIHQRWQGKSIWTCLMMVCLQSEQLLESIFAKLAKESTISLSLPILLGVAREISPNYHYVVKDSLTGRH